MTECGPIFFSKFAGQEQKNVVTSMTSGSYAVLHESRTRPDKPDNCFEFQFQLACLKGSRLTLEIKTVGHAFFRFATIILLQKCAKYQKQLYWNLSNRSLTPI